MSLTHLQRKSRKVNWHLAADTCEDGARIIVLSPETRWSDLLTRAEVRSDARILSNSLGCPIKIISSQGDELDLIGGGKK